MIFDKHLLSYSSEYNMINISRVSHILQTYLMGFWQVKLQQNMRNDENIGHIVRYTCDN